ncbi:hypothetical protein ACYZUD_03730 [Pseudomonas sp. XS1P51]
MVFPVPPLPNDVLIQPRDLDIIACRRPSPLVATDNAEVFGVRWASRPDLDWPKDGYLVERLLGGSAVPVGSNGGVFHLPKTDTWPDFAQGTENRRPIAGPYFPSADITEANLGYLLPIVRLVDPRTDPAEHGALTEIVAAALGFTHAEDAELTIAFWPGGEAPPLTVLLGNSATSGPVIAYYRREARGYLLALAVRFEYAVLLGLGTDDAVKKSDRDLSYCVKTALTHGSGSAVTDPIPTNRTCAPPAPKTFTAARVPGSVGHPAFNDFAGWVPAAELLAVDSNGNAQLPEALIPRAPAGITALTWSAPSHTGRMLDHNPVLYELGRFGHGAATAALSSPPPAPHETAYAPLFEGEQMLRSEDSPQALDAAGQPWPDMEGYYHYLIRGIDLLGEKSTAPAVTSVRHYDDLAPPPPGLRLVAGQTIDFQDASQTQDVALDIDWSGPQDFVGPDASEFRIAARWRARRPVHVEVQSVAPVPGDIFQGDVMLNALAEVANSLAGMRLILPDGEYPIVKHGSGAGASMRIRRVQNRLPASGQDGLIYAASELLAHQRIARLPRRPAVSTWVSDVLNTDPMRIRLTQAGAQALPADATVSAYVHILRASFRATFEGGDIWRIERPAPGDIRRESWEGWLALSDPAGVLRDAPVILFPPHEVSVTVSPPAGFGAGVLILDVTAADDTSYVASPALPGTYSSLTSLTGNESDPATATISARLLTPPDAPVVPTYDPNRFIWAETAAKYAEEASYRLTWTVNGAAHYEVWRVLEAALPGASPGKGDAQLRALALANPGKFAMRDLRIFGGHYRDSLPGRAPTRALYRVRSVSEAGIPGAWSGLIGPVHVPDIRQPPAPNLTRVAAPKPLADDPVAAERKLNVEWAQPGPDADLRFEIEAQDPATLRWRTAAILPRGTLPQPGPGRLFRTVLDGLVPGARLSLRVTAVREARDPVDPFGQVRRDIRSLPSEVRAGVPLGRLSAPANLTALPSGAGPAAQVALSWSNPDPYERIEVLRQGPDDNRMLRVSALEGAEAAFQDSGLAAGKWRYQLRALGHSHWAETVIVEVVAS